MVYYEQTPLIIKKEQPSQTQLCLQTLQTTTLPVQHHQSPHQHQLAPSHQNHSQQINPQHNTGANGQNYNVAYIMQQQQHQQLATNAATSITTTPNPSNYLANIKSEPSPGNIAALYNGTNQNLNNGNNSMGNPGNGISSTTAPNAPAAQANGGRKANGTKPQFKCEQCGMTFGSKSAHTSHTKSHVKNGELGSLTGPLPNAIEVNEAGVPLGIPKSPQIKPTANNGAGGDPYKCNVCQKTFAVPARLIRHYRTHTGERPFECEFCHKLFSVKENLQVHRRIHTKERPYKCDVCSRAFEHSGKLHRHMRIHTGERPHKCSVCEKTFIQSGQLVIHMRTHTGEKPYKCPVEGCGKGFTCSKQLKVHSRTHTGEKPYHCDICFRDFGYNHVLKLHRVQHYGSKCYKCTICDETFKSKKEMEAHIKGHANEMPDDEDNATVNTNTSGGTSTTASLSTSGAESTSPPNSPQSPTSSSSLVALTKVKKPRQTKNTKGSAANPTGASQNLGAINGSMKTKPNLNTNTSVNINPPSPASPISSFSPSPTSFASASRLSAGSPSTTSSSVASIASPMSFQLETDYHSRDSSVASSTNNQVLPASLTAPISSLLHPQNNQQHQHQQQQAQIMHPHQTNYDDMPTDLSLHQQHQQPNPLQQHPHLQRPSNNYYSNHSNLPITITPYNSYNPRDGVHPSNISQNTILSEQTQSQQQPLPQSQQPSQHQILQSLHSQQQQQQPSQPPHDVLSTINPALLEAATIARREEDVTQAALQILQLNRSHQKPTMESHLVPHQHQQNHPHHLPQQHQQQHHHLVHQHQQFSELSNYDDTHEANELIDYYKRGELVRHVQKGYAPVPKFESSLANNDIIVRQVEAAIAPYRSSTDSPERSSSPESDSMLMADRDIMTLPLRKRKLYINEEPNNGSLMENSSNNSSNNLGANASNEINGKVMRKSSVIQFAKAS